MNEQEIRTAEDNYVKMALTVAMAMNQFATAHAALTRLPDALAKSMPKYREVVASMREATKFRETQEERDGANGSLDHMVQVLDAIEKLSVDPAALKTVEALLEVQKKQVEEMIRDAKTNAPGVQ